MKNDYPDRSLDDSESTALASAYAEPSYDSDGEEYLLNDIGLALRLRDEWH